MSLFTHREKDIFWRIVLQCANRLPPEKPRYCMGIGYGEDLLVCAALGVDMVSSAFQTCEAALTVAQGGLRVSDENSCRFRRSDNVWLD